MDSNQRDTTHARNYQLTMENMRLEQESSLALTERGHIHPGEPWQSFPRGNGKSRVSMPGPRSSVTCLAQLAVISGHR